MGYRPKCNPFKSYQRKDIYTNEDKNFTTKSDPIDKKSIVWCSLTNAENKMKLKNGFQNAVYCTSSCTQKYQLCLETKHTLPYMTLHVLKQDNANMNSNFNVVFPNHLKVKHTYLQIGLTSNDSTINIQWNPLNPNFKGPEKSFLVKSILC
jgi:hypothetical protein